MESTPLKIIDYLRIVISPAKNLDKINEKTTSFFLVWLITVLGYLLPEYIIFPPTYLRGYGVPGTIVITIFASLIFYYPFIHGLGYLYWKFARGFNGNSSLVEMRRLIFQALYK